MNVARGLADRLGDALLPGPVEPTSRPETTDRILDAAARLVGEAGVDRTSMSAIAAGAGISREWLYRHFPNRDAVVAALVQRELRRFIDGLAIRAADAGDVVAALTEAFVYCVEYLRDHPMVEGLLDGRPVLGTAEGRAHAQGAVTVAVRTCAGYLVDLGGYDDFAAATIAETLTRLVGSTVVIPAAELDLHDAEVLRRYAERVVPAIVAGGAG